jgi:hypothetical protein
VPEKQSPGRRRRATPPPRDILAGQVKQEELPDVARPEAPAPTEQEAAAEAPASADLLNALARSVLEVGRLPLRVTEEALDGQAQAIDDWVARGAVPTVLVPGAAVLKAELRLLAAMVRVVSGPHSSRPPGTE